MLDLDPPQWIDRRSPRHKASRYAYMAQIISMHTLTPAPFSDEVHDMGDFVNAHPEILGDDVQIISRELEHGTDGRRLDFLVYDTESNQPGLVELKKDVADEKFLLQTLRYADWLRSNPDTIRYQLSRQQVDLDPDDVGGDIKIYIVAPRILPVVAELAQYIQGFEFAFIQLERFQGTDGDYLAAVTPLEVPNRTPHAGAVRSRLADLPVLGRLRGAPGTTRGRCRAARPNLRGVNRCAIPTPIGTLTR